MSSFWSSVIRKKFSKPAVLISLLLFALYTSVIITRQGIIGGLLIATVFIVIPVVYAVVVFPEFGIITLIVIAFIINHLSRIMPDDTPIGLIMDAMTYLLILGFLIKQRNERRWDYFSNPISYFMIAWLMFNLMEVVNPAAASKLAWVYTVRTIAFIMLMYFVFVFQIRTKQFIKLLFKIWLFMELIAAISAFQQENFGFFPFEQHWLTADPLRVSLLFIYGHMRKFGIFSDPVVFAYNMIISSLLCLGLMFSTISTNKKIILGFLMAFFLWVMLYSGTRAAFVLIPAALIMLAILKFNRRLIIGVTVVGVILAVLIKIPTSNGSLVRFQSAFRPSKDASFNVRAENQHRIKPYILSHPIGGGLGSVGVWGVRFAPNSYLAKFPPDSGYVRVAVEMGYLGLLLFCTLNFVILYYAIKYYYLIHDPDLQAYCLAMILVIFAIDIGNYPQQAIVQYPTNILFYLAMAIVNVVMRLDLQKRKAVPVNVARDSIS